MSPFLVVVALVAPLAVLANLEGGNVVLDHSLDFECPEGEVITSVYRIEGDQYGDRRFEFGCQAPAPGAIADNCGWTRSSQKLGLHYLQYLKFVCPSNFAFAGVRSFHGRLRFKCCKDNSYVETPCRLTNYVNEFAEALNFTAPANTIIRGWRSWYNNEAERRHDSFFACDIKKGTVTP